MHYLRKFQDTKEVIRRQYNTMTKRYQRGNQKDRQYNTMTERQNNDMYIQQISV